MSTLSTFSLVTFMQFNYVGNKKIYILVLILCDKDKIATETCELILIKEDGCQYDSNFHFCQDTTFIFNFNKVLTFIRSFFH